jgi:hypothetical protein
MYSQTSGVILRKAGFASERKPAELLAKLQEEMNRPNLQ